MRIPVVRQKAWGLRDSRPMGVYRIKNRWIVPRTYILNGGLWVSGKPLEFADNVQQLAKAIKVEHNRHPSEAGTVDLDQFERTKGLVTALGARSERSLRNQVQRFKIENRRDGKILVSERRADHQGIFRKHGRARSFDEESFSEIAEYIHSKLRS